MLLDPRDRDSYLGFLGIAYVFMGHYAEAIPAFEQHLTHEPSDSAGPMYLAIAYSEVGRKADALTQVREILQRNLRFSLGMMIQRLRPTDSRWTNRWRADLEDAGLSSTTRR